MGENRKGRLLGAVALSCSLAQLRITQYCNLYGAHAGSHNNDPVENMPGHAVAEP